MAIQLDCMLHISFHYEAPPSSPPRPFQALTRYRRTEESRKRQGQIDNRNLLDGETNRLHVYRQIGQQ